jgi:hypothetical protein
MNDRIRELAEQAGIAVWGDAVYMYDPEDTLDSTVMEKFAEMIASECVKIAESKMVGGGTAREIREHFGLTKK